MTDPTQILSDFFEGLDSYDDPWKLKDHVVDQLKALGAAMVSYHHMPPPGARDYDAAISVVADGFPQAWVDLYRDERLYEIDPIPKAALETVHWFFWHDVDQHLTLTDKQKHYLTVLSQQGLGNGIAVPVFGPFGRDGYVGIGFGSNQTPAQTVLNFMAVIAQFGHQRFCQILAADKVPEGALSEREQEILYWVVRGKSNSIIASITDLSPHTVDAHLRKIFRKLSVHDRVSASLRALSLGLIT